MMTPQRFDELRANAESGSIRSGNDLLECLDEIACLAALVYVPGGWHCPQCKFRLISSVLYARTGNVGVNHAIPDPCPNDGTALEPDTWKADAREMSEQIPKIVCMDLINRLRADEGDSVLILCDNPDGPPNNAIECNGGWTLYEPERFSGETLIQCLAKAEEAKAKVSGKP